LKCNHFNFDFLLYTFPSFDEVTPPTTNMNAAKTEAEPLKLKTEPAIKEELDVKDLQNIIGANKAEQRKTFSSTTSAVKEETKDLSLFSTFQSALVRLFTLRCLQILTTISSGPRSESGDSSGPEGTSSQAWPRVPWKVEFFDRTTCYHLSGVPGMG
jgi:hypothetical protein